jgi:hypothetical protein
MKLINLNQLAAKVAVSDAAPGKNIDIVDVKVVWARTFALIRAMPLLDALMTILALLRRAGKKAALLALACLCLAGSGCTLTMVGAEADPVAKTWKANVKRFSILQKVEAPEVSVPGIFEMKGYRNDGGSDLIARLIALGLKKAEEQAAAAAAAPIVTSAVAP